MAVRVSHKFIVLALLLILFICSPTQARSVRKILISRTLLVVDKDQETRDSRQDGGGSEGDGLMDMDYNSANKKRPIHNR
uniref:Root meristem growth factor 9 n=1 Tax=Noccaea caerulescens TaxID=107243 RepID=A0A1J3EUN9_NOCCA